MTESTLPAPEAPITNHEAPNHQALRPLWFSILVGPIVYSIYFLVGYMVAEAACKADLLRFTFLGMDGLAATELLLTVITVAIIGAGIPVALRVWQRTDVPPREESVARFLAFGALLLNPLFILTTAVTGGVLVFLQPCSWV